MTAVVILLPLALLLVAGVTQLGANGVIKRNGFVGLRIPSTLRSDAGWLAGHRAAATPAWIGFAVTTVAGVAALLSEVAFPFVTIELVAWVLTFVFAIVMASRAASAAPVDNHVDSPRT
ncbi:MAG: SdpI family protein [Rhodoglobus sp.]